MATVARMVVRVLGDSSDFDKTMQKVAKSSDDTSKQISTKLDPSVQKVVDRFREMNAENKKVSISSSKVGRAITILTGRLGGTARTVKHLTSLLPGWTKVVGLAGIAVAKMGMAGVKAFKDMEEAMDSAEGRAKRMTAQEITIAGGKTGIASTPETGMQKWLKRGDMLAAMIKVGETREDVAKRYDRGAVLTQERVEEKTRLAEARAKTSRAGRLAGNYHQEQIPAMLAQYERLEGKFGSPATYAADERRKAAGQELMGLKKQFAYRGGFAGIGGRLRQGITGAVGEFGEGMFGRLQEAQAALPQKALGGMPGINQALEAGSEEGIQALRANQKGDRKDTSENIKKIKETNSEQLDVAKMMFDWIKDHGTETIGL